MSEISHLRAELKTERAERFKVEEENRLLRRENEELGVAVRFATRRIERFFEVMDQIDAAEAEIKSLETREMLGK